MKKIAIKKVAIRKVTPMKSGVAMSGKRTRCK